jgi:AhpD family alkylhydroperoxidase
MEPRIKYQKHAEKMKGMFALEQSVRASGLEHSLLELMKMRASIINGCAFCIDMHSKDARAAGETEQRLYGLAAWREAPYYTDRERAALEWTDSLTLISTNDVPDEIYERVRQQFSEEEIVSLTLAVAAINSWNRIAISMRTVPGTYHVPAKAAAAAAPATT